MKKAFTMIELIFIIVILGILAAIAIPKLAATRDDAELSKAATNLSTAVQDLASFYTSQGNFESKLGTMTNVPLTDAAGSPTNGLDGFLRIKGQNCAYIRAVKGGTASEPAKNGVVGTSPAFILVATNDSYDADGLGDMYIFDENGDSETLTKPVFSSDPICKDFADLPAVKGITQSESSVKMCVRSGGTKNRPELDCKTTKFVKGVQLVGGKGVKYEI